MSWVPSLYVTLTLHKSDVLKVNLTGSRLKLRPVSLPQHRNYIFMCKSSCVLLCLLVLRGRCTLAEISNVIFPGSDLWTERVQPPANTSEQVVGGGHNKQVRTCQVKQQRHDGSIAGCNMVQTKAELVLLWKGALKENETGLFVGHVTPAC